HAIGNIRMQDCVPWRSLEYCPSTGDYFHCANKVCIDATYVCDFEDDCGDRSDERNCDQSRMMSFESGYGRWGGGVRKGWSIKNAASFLSLRDGPTYDHTTGMHD